jgi:carbamoyltransferase
MPNVLGLHFGHDAAASVVRDGSVLATILRERISKKKHVAGLDRQTIEIALAAANLDLASIDFVGVSTTQGMPLSFADKSWLSLEFGVHAGHSQVGKTWEAILQNRGYWGSPIFPGLDEDGRFSDTGVSIRDNAGSVFVYPAITHFHSADTWLNECGLGDLAVRDFRKQFEQNHSDMFYVPLIVRIGDRSIPGYFIEHHYCHAASAFYACPYFEAALLTHDGGGTMASGYAAGMMYYGTEKGLFPITPHHLVAGMFYEMVSRWLGLGADLGGPGKMMGLSGYGRPSLFDERFVGNWYDIQRQAKLFGLYPADLLLGAWKHITMERARSDGLDVAPLGVPRNATATVNATIAASAQRVFEETMLAAVRCLDQIVRRHVAPASNLVLSGGAALNVVANQRIVNETPFRDVFVNAGCDDSGLSAGAALAIYHGILGAPKSMRAAKQNASPFLGREISVASLERAVSKFEGRIEVDRPASAAGAAAEDLAAGLIVAWCEGRSEIGPRALGHRSILADPRHADQWEKVNRIKVRELWRPLAPAVLAEATGTVFAELSVSSPYMSFNAKVIADNVPAITHVDGTARIQSVTPDCGEYYQVLKIFFNITGVPVVMNTSFNGPSQPIIDTAEDAIEFFLNSALSVLYICNARITRAPA